MVQALRANGQTQGELSLTGIGETLLHPEWADLVRLAREALPTNYINFSTNGLLLTDSVCEVLAEHGIRVWVSLHRPEKAGPALNRAARWGILDGPNASAATSSFDWAGQIDWEVTAPHRRASGSGRAGGTSSSTAGSRRAASTPRAPGWSGTSTTSRGR
jgi:hypothetical protein